MPPTPDTPPPSDNSRAARRPPATPPELPPVIRARPSPPILSRESSPLRLALAILLSLYLGLFLADAVVSLVDDSLTLFLGLHLLTLVRGMLFLFALLMGILVYGLMGLTPMIPKRLFIPLTLFSPVAGLIVVPLMILFYHRMQEVSWGVSFVQLLVGLGILYCAQGGFRLRWPPVEVARIRDRRFSWLNLGGFVAVNLFVLLPAVVVYLALCAGWAVDHFSAGFVALRPAGVTVRVKDYVRADGRTIQLIPMSHIGEPAFYRELSRSLPTNAVILMEGVSDNRNLLTNRITYERVATSLGLAEQAVEFEPRQGELVDADIDVEQFGTNTIHFLNIIMLIHAKGVNPETVATLLRYQPPRHVEQELLADLLGKRNRHLLQEIHARLPDSPHLVVPWGAAHMPEIATELQKAGFREHKTREYRVIGFGSTGGSP